MVFTIIQSNDSDILTDILYNIDDLIYADDEEYFSISKSIVNEMIQALIQLGIERVLYELYQRIQKNERYAHISEEIRRLISVIVTYKKSNE
jgi:hypothetical protein